RRGADISPRILSYRHAWLQIPAAWRHYETERRLVPPCRLLCRCRSASPSDAPRALCRGLHQGSGRCLNATSSAWPARWTWASSHILAVARLASPGEQRVALDRLRRLLGQEAAGE